MSSDEDRLPPWARLTAQCDRCKLMATLRIDGSNTLTYVEGDGVPVILLENEHPRKATTIACERHAYEIADEWLIDLGLTCIRPLKYTWWYWLTSGRRPLRFIGNLQTAIHNWRFDRGATRVLNLMLDQDTKPCPPRSNSPSPPPCAPNTPACAPAAAPCPPSTP